MAAKTTKISYYDGVLCRMNGGTVYNYFDIREFNNDQIRAAIMPLLPDILDLFLTPQQKQIYLLKYVSRMKNRQIAQLLNVSDSTISRHLKTANRKLLPIGNILYKILINISNKED